MKRHPSLAHLSRDHHGALILARLLQKNAPAYKGLPTDLVGKADYAFKFYTDELVKHFAQEEKAFALVKGSSEKVDQLLQRIIEEHRTLHQSFNSIKSHEAQAEHLDELGKLLEVHVRKEEREFFPLIEQTCNEDLMNAIEQSLLSHE
ncbi:hypothetical protein BH11BAC3_BH11BAC3_30450 [soil metagenome]